MISTWKLLNGNIKAILLASKGIMFLEVVRYTIIFLYILEIDITFHYVRIVMCQNETRLGLIWHDE